MIAHPDATALMRCIRILGSQQIVADLVGMSQQTVSDVVCRSRPVPAEWCRPLEAATAAKGERVPAADLRPDLFTADAASVSGVPSMVPTVRGASAAVTGNGGAEISPEACAPEGQSKSQVAA